MPYRFRGGGPPTPRLPAAVLAVVSRRRGPVGPRGRRDQLTNNEFAAWLARLRSGSGTMPNKIVAATPRPTTAPLNTFGTTTSGPSGTGSLKNISTITRA